MEVPPQRRPKHHGYLPRGTTRRSEVGGRRVGDGGDEEVIISQARLPEAVYLVLLRLLWRCLSSGRSIWVCEGVSCDGWLGVVVVVVVIFAVEYDGPAGWEDIVVRAEIVGPELDAAKHWGDGEGLAVRQMDDRRGHLYDQESNVGHSLLRAVSLLSAICPEALLYMFCSVLSCTVLPVAPPSLAVVCYASERVLFVSTHAFPTTIVTYSYLSYSNIVQRLVIYSYRSDFGPTCVRALPAAVRVGSHPTWHVTERLPKLSRKPRLAIAAARQPDRTTLEADETVLGAEVL